MNRRKDQGLSVDGEREVGVVTGSLRGLGRSTLFVAVKMHDFMIGFEVPEDWQSHFDRKTGLVHTFDDDLMAKADDAEESDCSDNNFDTNGDWGEEEKALAREITSDLKSKQFVPLPTMFEFHEYRLMEEFVDEIEEGDKQDPLRYAIRGRGAFRRFKDTAHRLGVIDDWYAYREKAVVRLITRWVHDHDILIDDEPTTGAD